MYMNNCQKYIAELLNEYGPLLQRQLLALVRHHFKTEINSLDGYISQMCKLGGYEKTGGDDEAVIGIKGSEPDYDVIRSMEVVLAFLPQVIWHRKSKGYVSICFFISTPEHDKEIYIVPVKQGAERQISKFVDDKFENIKCEVVMFLLETAEQMELIKPECCCKFALIKHEGVRFFKK